MSFFKVKNRLVFVASSMIVLWLLYVNAIQRFSLQERVAYLNAALTEYVTANSNNFSDLVLNLSSSRGVWDERQHRVFTLLNPEHCDLNYWMKSKGSSSLAKLNFRPRDLDVEGITEGVSTVDVFLIKDAQPIIVEIQEREMSLEQCEQAGGYYGGGCRYEFATRSLRFFTLHSASFRQQLISLIMQCGGDE